MQVYTLIRAYFVSLNNCKGMNSQYTINTDILKQCCQFNLLYVNMACECYSDSLPSSHIMSVVILLTVNYTETDIQFLKPFCGNMTLNVKGFLSLIQVLEGMIPIL